MERVSNNIVCTLTRNSSNYHNSPSCWLARPSVRSRIWRGRGSSAHNQNKHLGEPLGARLFWFFVRHSASAPSAARLSNAEGFLFSTDFWGVAYGLSMVLNFFSKKVHKKLI